MAFIAGHPAAQTTIPELAMMSVADSKAKLILQLW
jgi:hypothetical protein